MLSADTAIRTIIIVTIIEMVVLVVTASVRNRGYVARNLHAVFRTEVFCIQISTHRHLLISVMVRPLLGIMERTTIVVLVSVACTNLFNCFYTCVATIVVSDSDICILSLGTCMVVYTTCST